VPTRFKWSLISDERLLDTRICDLPIKIKGSFIEPHIKRLYSELNDRGIRFKPHVWLSAEWFTPDGVPGFAIPFYLAHPRLMKLERKFMREVEGGTDVECMRILRHEAGHAIDNAFRLHFKRRWIRMFGSFTQKYPPSYKPKPNSRRYVLNLDAWYAQAHPAEDFAETFAVWLQPRSNWRRRYRGWPALRKLEYVDRLMHELTGQAPRVRSRAKPYSLARERMTLGAYYERKRAHYSVGFSDAYDRDLKRLFSEAKGTGDRREAAAAFLRRHRREVRSIVAKWTGEYQLTLNQVLDQMIGRCKELRLVADGPERNVVLDFAIMLTVHGMNYLYRGREWHAM
jgi:hypothetical protein